MNKNIKSNYKLLFGKRLKTLRVARGLSQEALASYAGLDRTYISSCERGCRNISLENIHRLAEALSVPVDSLFRDEEKPDEI